jgi:hypothetical protein
MRIRQELKLRQRRSTRASRGSDHRVKRMAVYNWLSRLPLLPNPPPHTECQRAAVELAATGLGTSPRRAARAAGPRCPPPSAASPSPPRASGSAGRGCTNTGVQVTTPEALALSPPPTPSRRDGHPAPGCWHRCRAPAPSCWSSPCAATASWTRGVRQQLAEQERQTQLCLALRLHRRAFSCPLARPEASRTGLAAAPGTST